MSWGKLQGKNRTGANSRTAGAESISEFNADYHQCLGERRRWPIPSWSCMKGPCWKVTRLFAVVHHVTGWFCRSQMHTAQWRAGLDHHLGTELLRRYLDFGAGPLTGYFDSDYLGVYMVSSTLQLLRTSGKREKTVLLYVKKKLPKLRCPTNTCPVGNTYMQSVLYQNLVPK